MRNGDWMLRARARRTIGRLSRPVGLVVCGLLGAGLVAHASADIVVPRDFSTIQAAVDAAPAGATIKIQRGTYTEQLVIAKNVILRGAGAGQTVIKAPATIDTYAVDVFGPAPVGAIVRITDGANVSLSGVTVTGPTPCFAVSGVVVVKGATLDLHESQVTLIRPDDPGCPITFRSSGVVIGLPFFVVIDGETDGGSIGHGTVTQVAVDKYLTTGIAVLGPFAGPPSTATLKENVITGGNPFTAPGQGGITVSFAAVAQVTENTIRGTVCTDATICGRDPINQFQSVGIGLNSIPAGTVIEENRLSSNDVGIYLFGSDGCCRTRKNTVTDSRFFGIVVQDGVAETSENKISGGEVGIGVVADFVDTVAVSRDDQIKQTSVAPVQEIECCGFTATAIRTP